MCVYKNETSQAGIKIRIKHLEEKVLYPEGILEKYEDLLLNSKIHTNRKRKEFQKELADFMLLHPTIEKDLPKLRESHFIRAEADLLKSQLFDNTEELIQSEVAFLSEREFIRDGILTDKGVIASQIHEVEPLILSSLLMNGSLNTLTTKQLIGIFSCFIDVKVTNPSVQPTNDILETINKEIVVYSNEAALRNKQFDLKLQYDLMNYTMSWCDCETEEDCKLVLQKMESEGIFLGDFVKAVLKIVNIAREAEKVALMFDLVIMEAVSFVPNVMLKYMVNNQSLYI
jgi:superfamily II RNA helicase